MNKARIAFMGLGIMGSGMARRLLHAGFPLTVFNRNLEKAEPFHELGAHIANSPREAVSNADVIISMVSDDEASRSLWLGANGALPHAAPGTVCIESSTITVGWARELALRAIDYHCDFLDAPVTGSKTHANSGELNFLVGGKAATLEKVRPVFAAMSKKIVLVGPAGTGAMLKLINNFVCGVQVASVAEAMAMIERGGLNRSTALEVIAEGAPGSPLVKTVSARMTTADYTPHFLLRLMAKDLGYAVREGNRLSLELMTATAALERFQVAIDARHSEKDMAAVVESLRETSLPMMASSSPGNGSELRA